jgi:glycerol uptake facilitator-like aquaporin
VPDSLLMSFNFGIAVLIAVQVKSAWNFVKWLIDSDFLKVVGHVSLAMINPVVTLAAVIHGKLSIVVGNFIENQDIFNIILLVFFRWV